MAGMAASDQAQPVTAAGESPALWQDPGPEAARMVGGYQGGEVNPVTGHVAVRQYLAHAWVEYWVEGEGWVRIDRTLLTFPSLLAPCQWSCW